MPTPLVSLLDMLKAYSHIYAQYLSNIFAWSVRLDDRECSPSDGSPIDLDELEADCAELEMDVAIDQIDRVRGYIRDGKSREILTYGLNELRSRILAHLYQKYFYYVRPSHVNYYGRALDGFGQKAIDRFGKDAGWDMVEAGTCLALGRSTASVYHLMLVVEVALRSLAAFLGTEYAPAWDGYIKAVKKRLDTPWKDRPEEWRHDEALYRDVLTDLEALKYSLRNPSMHPRQKYTDEEAVLIHRNMCRFMQHLAGLIPSPQARA